jgi:hypothetical protein
MYREEKDETMRDLHRMALMAYSGVAPHNRVVFDGEAVALKWDFHSLLQTIQFLLSVMLTDGSIPLRVCPGCDRAFHAADVRAVFCSKGCKNRQNVRKSINNGQGAQ